MPSRANPKLPYVAPEHFDQVYLPHSVRYIYDTILIYYFLLGGSIENEKQ